MLAGMTARDIFLYKSSTEIESVSGYIEDRDIPVERQACPQHNTVAGVV